MNSFHKIFAQILILSAFLGLGSCNENQMTFAPPVVENTIENKVTNIGRSSWQKPQLVIEKLGDVSNKTIADIGAGTGYFTFRMAFKAKKIIATDIDTNMIAIINEFAVNLPTEIQNKIETRLVKADDPMIKKGECDIIVIINTLAYIDKQQEYLSKLHSVMNAGDTLMVVDFKSSNISGIAQDYKIIQAGKVQEILKAAGFIDPVVDTKTLDYQYIITAKA